MHFISRKSDSKIVHYCAEIRRYKRLSSSLSLNFKVFRDLGNPNKYS
ncbi:hypothetical protein LEP1GSC186_3187 [Leptospira noguchii serovar Autumnalis str. ZUN142]|uniref:Uncharacterized protein n=1 Tax=Leptospira noguchii serovar Autumnalis str. ZUN142 TaxID=1085540 RepID=M6U705_9LEPT|nr:hypothetical protein LEP1GSC186_3187 [Leptospira noguchii serovar Autumnalis str. ZUN142]